MSAAVDRQVLEVLGALRRGGVLVRGCHSGWWLADDGPRRRVAYRVVAELQAHPDVERVDDRASVVGEEWGIVQ